MPLDAARVRVIIFDIDGTLSDTDDRWVKRAVRLLTPLRFLFPSRDVQPAARKLVMAMDGPGNAVFALIDRLHLDAPLARLTSLFKRRKPHQPSRDFTLIAGTLEMLSALSPHYPLAVFTARDQASTSAFLEQFQLNPFFHAVATSLTCTHTKPYPDPILWIARQLEVEPINCLMVGDTVVDIRAGKAAGAQTIGVTCGFGSPEELTEAQPDLILPSPSALVDLLILA